MFRESIRLFFCLHLSPSAKIVVKYFLGPTGGTPSRFTAYESSRFGGENSGTRMSPFSMLSFLPRASTLIRLAGMSPCRADVQIGEPNASSVAHDVRPMSAWCNSQKRYSSS